MSPRPTFKRFLTTDNEIHLAATIGTHRCLEARDMAETSAREKTADYRLAYHIRGALAEISLYRLLGLPIDLLPDREWAKPQTDRIDLWIDGQGWGIRSSVNAKRTSHIRDLDPAPQLCVWIEPRMKWIQLLGFTTLEDLELYQRSDEYFAAPHTLTHHEWVEATTGRRRSYWTVDRSILEPWEEFMAIAGLTDSDLNAQLLEGDW